MRKSTQREAEAGSRRWQGKLPWAPPSASLLEIGVGSGAEIDRLSKRSVSEEFAAKPTSVVISLFIESVFMARVQGGDTYNKGRLSAMAFLSLNEIEVVKDENFPASDRAPTAVFTAAPHTKCA